VFSVYSAPRAGSAAMLVLMLILVLMIAFVATDMADNR
jgi:hypothetical protein